MDRATSAITLSATCANSAEQKANSMLKSTAAEPGTEPGAMRQTLSSRRKTL